MAADRALVEELAACAFDVAKRADGALTDELNKLVEWDKQTLHAAYTECLERFAEGGSLGWLPAALLFIPLLTRPHVTYHRAAARALRR